MDDFFVRHGKTTMNATSKFAALLLAAGSGLAMPAPAATQDTPWLVRARAVDLLSANRDCTGVDLSIDNKIIPELDMSYLFTPQWSMELVVTYPQKQTIGSGGVDIGSLRRLPPTLTRQFRLTSGQVGIGYRL